VNNAAESALHAAAYGDHVEAARELLDAGISVSLRNSGRKLAAEVASAAVAALIAAHVAWHRRRAAAIACYGDVWGWD